LLALADLWEAWHDADRDSYLCTFTIVTTEANGEMAQVHNRMPVILEESDWPVWLGETEGDPKSLMRPASEGMLRIWPVSRKVNSPANNGPELLDVVSEPQQSGLALRQAGSHYPRAAARSRPAVSEQLPQLAGLPVVPAPPSRGSLSWLPLLVVSPLAETMLQSGR